MKKLLVALLAITTASAFAGNSMVRLDGCFDGQCDNLDLRMAGDDVKNAEGKLQNIALNYAMAFAGNFGAGLTYKQNTKTSDGNKSDPSYVFGQSSYNNSNEIVLSGYYNIHGGWDDSCFIGLHYGMVTVDDGDTTADSGWKQTNITLEYGHRFKVGSLAGLNFNWAPSVSYTMSTAKPNGSGDDIKGTDLMINAANIAVTF